MSCSSVIPETLSYLDEEDDLLSLRRAVVRSLRLCQSSQREMDYLRKLQQLDELPVKKIHVIKYVTLRWFLFHGCLFASDIKRIADFDDWKMESDMKKTFQFRKKKFDLVITTLDGSEKFIVNLAFSEGQVSVATRMEYVPEFLTRRSITDEDQDFMFEFLSKLNRIFYDGVLRSVVYGESVNVQGRDSRYGDVFIPCRSPPEDQ